MAAAQINEMDVTDNEMSALEELISALFQTEGMDEVEPLVLRYQEAAKALSERDGGGVATRS